MVRWIAAGALALVVARSRIADVPDAGVVLGAGDPAVCVDVSPDCGCDACDSGSQDELDVIDARVLAVVSGSFRYLSRGPRRITVIDRDGSWSGRDRVGGGFARGEIEATIADPAGWREVSGAPWW